LCPFRIRPATDRRNASPSRDTQAIEQELLNEPVKLCLLRSGEGIAVCVTRVLVEPLGVRDPKCSKHLVSSRYAIESASLAKPLVLTVTRRVKAAGSDKGSKLMVVDGETANSARRSLGVERFAHLACSRLILCGFDVAPGVPESLSGSSVRIAASARFLRDNQGDAVVEGSADHSALSISRVYSPDRLLPAVVYRRYRINVGLR